MSCWGCVMVLVSAVGGVLITLLLFNPPLFTVNELTPVPLAPVLGSVNRTHHILTLTGQISLISETVDSVDVTFFNYKQMNLRIWWFVINLMQKSINKGNPSETTQVWTSEYTQLWLCGWTCCCCDFVYPLYILTSAPQGTDGHGTRDDPSVCKHHCVSLSSARGFSPVQGKITKLYSADQFPNCVPVCCKPA